MGKLKKIFTNPRIIILIAALLLALLAINPRPWNDGLAIRSVVKDSAANLAGIENPPPTITPVARERVLAVNNIPVNTLQEYNELVNSFPANTTFLLKTNKNLYKIVTKPIIEEVELNETVPVNVTEEVFNATTNTTQNITKEVLVNKTFEKLAGVEDIGLRLFPAPVNNILKGLDLSGGTRVLLKPEKELPQEDMDLLLDNMNQRLNVFGLSDVTITTTEDLSGNTYILVEIPGANVEEVQDLISQQGKFEAKVGDTVVLVGGKDITNVCKTPECSGIFQGCSRQGSEYYCKFQFDISLSPEAAQRQADATRDLSVVYDNGEGYLNESLDLYLDDELVDSLRIAEGLKGQVATKITISGPGVGITQSEAIVDAQTQMKHLQTILITGSLPVKLQIVKTDTITPLLGQAFLNNVMLVAIIAVVAVSLVIFLRYRRPLIVVPVVITLVSEIVILLGAAALIRWHLDLVAIAGIIIAIGVGVDAQIIIADETLRKEVQAYSNWKEKIKNAFFIIMASYFTLFVAMLPLLSAGAGMLKGFAVTTILGVSIGVFITRPAFAKLAEILLKNE